MSVVIRYKLLKYSHLWSVRVMDQYIPNPGVVGSNPAGRTIYPFSFSKLHRTYDLRPLAPSFMSGVLLIDMVRSWRLKEHRRGASRLHRRPARGGREPDQ